MNFPQVLTSPALLSVILTAAKASKIFSRQRTVQPQNAVTVLLHQQTEEPPPHPTTTTYREVVGYCVGFLGNRFRIQGFKVFVICTAGNRFPWAMKWLLWCVRQIKRNIIKNIYNKKPKGTYRYKVQKRIEICKCATGNRWSKHCYLTAWLHLGKNEFLNQGRCANSS